MKDITTWPWVRNTEENPFSVDTVHIDKPKLRLPYKTKNIQETLLQKYFLKIVHIVQKPTSMMAWGEPHLYDSTINAEKHM